MCIRIYILNFKKQQTNKQKQESKKQKKLKKKTEFLRKIDKKKKNAAAGLKIFLDTRISGNKSIFFGLII